MNLSQRGLQAILAWLTLSLTLIGGAYFYRLIIPGEYSHRPPAVEASQTAAVMLSDDPLVPTFPAPPGKHTPDENRPGSIAVTIYPPIQAYERAGFGISLPAPAPIWASRLGSSWYLDWGTQMFSEDHLEYWRMVRMGTDGYRPSLSEILRLAQTDPGRVWILGNEPDVIWQDNQLPQEYARKYHELYQVIKESDPTASIAVAGISQATPLRLAYLERVLQAYQDRYGVKMPVDWWTVHGFVLREEKDSWGVDIPPGLNASQGKLYEISDHGRLDYFENQLRDFRTWMAQNGYRQTPLALTEFGILMPEEYGFPPEMVSQYLQDSFQILLELSDEQTGLPTDSNRLVQRWAWFSLADPNFPVSDLADLTNDRLTPVGEAYRAFIQSIQQP